MSKFIQIAATTEPDGCHGHRQYVIALDEEGRVWFSKLTDITAQKWMPMREHPSAP